MRIALLTDGIWPFVIGGMQKHSYYMCKYLSSQGICIDLYYTSRKDHAPDLSSHFSVEELKYITGHYIPYPVSDSLPGKYLRSSYKYSQSIANELVKNPPVDLIYAKGLAGWDLIKRKSDGVKLPPVCINVHGYEYYQKAPSFKSWLQQLMLRPAFQFVNKNADYIYSYGGRITEIIKRHIPNSRDRIVEIPTGIEEEFLTPAVTLVNKPRSFVFIGRFERRKGVKELFKAFRHIDSTAFRLHIIGYVPQAVRKRNTTVEFYGQLNDKQAIRNIVSKSDVIICPSYAEGMPNVILEGMASGCAVIAADVGAIPVLVGKDNGWLINAGSVRQLRSAINQAISCSDHDLLLKKSASIDKIKSHFLWKNIIHDLIHSFQLIIDKRHRVA